MVTRFLALSLLFLTVCMDLAENKNLALETNDITDQAISNSINYIFDIILNHYTKKLVEEGRTEIEVAGIDEKFSTKILGVVLQAELLVDDGWVRNISSVQRTGDADITRKDEKFTLTAHLGLRELSIDYNKYYVNILGEYHAGKLYVKVGRNSIGLQINMDLKPTCTVTLTDLRIEKLENIEVDITNLGPFESLTDEITSYVVNVVIKWYKNYIEKVMYPNISNAIKEANICHYIPI